MPTILRLLLYSLHYIVLKIFRTFDKEVTEKCAIEWCEYDKIINMDKRIEKVLQGKKAFCTNKTHREKRVLERFVCIFSEKKAFQRRFVQIVFLVGIFVSQHV